MVSTSTLPLADTATSTATLQHSSKADDAAATLRLVSLLRKFGTWNFSPITGMIVMTPSSSDILGYSTNAAVHITTLLRALTKSDRSHIFASYRRLINLQSREEVADLVLSSERGESRYLRAAFRLLHEGEIGTGEILGLVQSTSEEHAISNQLERLTYYDAVTSLPNRKKFDDIFAERLEQRKQFGGKLAFLIVDLTRFREVNFALSHVVGDDLLRMVAQRIRGVLCNNDEVARVGTRFPILLQDADGEHAARCAAEICSALEAPFPLQDISYEIGAHIGISLCPDDDLTYRGLLRKADIAVEQAAHKGQSVAKYDVTTDKHTPYRLALVGDFRHAAKNDEIRLYCQPKIEMRTRTVIGVEVLARWLHPTKGLIPPDDFVQLIEGTELIHVLTNHMLANAAQCLLRWQALGIAVPLAVNLSTQDVATPALSRYLAALLRSTQIDPKFIELEVTERSLIRNPTTSIGELNRLRDMGFRLSIDDFGTGYSSLNYLTQLPVDVIKIDHSFTMKMIRDQRSAAIVRSTIHMAHDLGMTVVAEGTADVDIWNALEALDCDEAQGYYIARPMPVEDFSTWLHNAGASFNRASVNQSR